MSKDNRPHTLTRTNAILHTSSTYPRINWNNSCPITGTYKGTYTCTSSCTGATTSYLHPSSCSSDTVMHATTYTLDHSSLRSGREHTHNNVLRDNNHNDGDDTHESMIPLHACSCLFMNACALLTISVHVYSCIAYGMAWSHMHSPAGVSGAKVLGPAS